MFIDESHDNDRQDAIQSILNGAMGKAADTLAMVIQNPVEFSLPKTSWVNKNNLGETISSLNLPSQSIVTRQSFRGHLRGEIMVLLEKGSKHYKLGEIMGYEKDIDKNSLQELTLEIANVLSGACISGLSKQLNIKLNFGAPSLLSSSASINQILENKELLWTDALFMDVSYTVDHFDMTTHLMLCMIEEDSHQLYSIIDQQIEQH